MTTMTFRDLNSGQGALSTAPMWDLAGLRTLLLVWLQRARQRQQLAELSDRQLEDIGISRAQAIEEARKPFWRL